MTVTFEPFRMTHSLELADVRNPYQKVLHTLQRITDGDMCEGLREIAENEFSWTARGEHGDILGFCGIELLQNTAWAFMRPGIELADALAMTKKVKEVLRSHAEKIGPVRARVDPGDDKAVDWAKLLGFKKEDEEWWVFA